MRTFPIAVFAAAVSLFAAGCAQSPENPAAPGGFVAVIAADADTSADWYKSVFDLTEARRIEQDAFEIVLLKGEDAMIEVIEFKPAAPENPGRTQGLFKAGFVLSDFDSKVAQWRADGVAFSGNGQVFYDEALGYHSITLLDPDGVRIQVFGVSETEPKT